MPRTFPPTAVRLASRTVRDGDCILYTAGEKMKSGHTKITHEGRRQLVHRVAWQLANGAIPGGLCVCHSCDRPRCVHVDHLWLGTSADNNADRDRKGRQVALRGEANGTAVLTDAQREQIIAEYVPYKNSTFRLAAKYGVHQATVWKYIHEAHGHYRKGTIATYPRTGAA